MGLALISVCSIIDSDVSGPYLYGYHNQANLSIVAKKNSKAERESNGQLIAVASLTSLRGLHPHLSKPGTQMTYRDTSIPFSDGQYVASIYWLGLDTRVYGKSCEFLPFEATALEAAFSCNVSRLSTSPFSFQKHACYCVHVQESCCIYLGKRHIQPLTRNKALLWHLRDLFMCGESPAHSTS